MINKDVRKSLARKNRNKTIIWIWNVSIVTKSIDNHYLGIIIGYKNNVRTYYKIIKETK